MCRVAPWPDCCAVTKTGVFAEEGPENDLQKIVCDMPYESACALAGAQPLSARRYELRRRFFRSITQSESCLHNFLFQRRDLEILFRLLRHSVYSIPLTKTEKFDLIFTMPWPNLSNKINKILLTALYIDVY